MSEKIINLLHKVLKEKNEQMTLEDITIIENAFEMLTGGLIPFSQNYEEIENMIYINLLTTMNPLKSHFL